VSSCATGRARQRNSMVICCLADVREGEKLPQLDDERLVMISVATGCN
jgi:hypothetical protein